MNNEPSQSPDGESAGRLENSSAEPQTSSSRTPLRQLLHWATGDRAAEAQALADETLALRNSAEQQRNSDEQQRNSDEQQGVQEGEQQAEAVLAAAKSAVSLAHGDSLVPGEASREIYAEELDDGTNLLAQWEDASSFTETPPADTDRADTEISAISPDVARPADVEVIVNVESNP